MWYQYIQIVTNSNTFKFRAEIIGLQCLETIRVLHEQNGCWCTPFSKYFKTTRSIFFKHTCYQFMIFVRTKVLECHPFNTCLFYRFTVLDHQDEQYKSQPYLEAYKGVFMCLFVHKHHRTECGSNMWCWGLYHLRLLIKHSFSTYWLINYISWGDGDSTQQLTRLQRKKPYPPTTVGNKHIWLDFFFTSFAFRLNFGCRETSKSLFKFHTSYPYQLFYALSKLQECFRSL